MARPRADIDEEKLKKYLRLKPRLADVAGLFEVSEDTIERFIRKKWKCSFAEFRDQNMAHTRMSLVQACLKKALEGDNTMLIWCTKNLNNWTDKLTTAEKDSTVPKRLIIEMEGKKKK